MTKVWVGVFVAAPPYGDSINNRAPLAQTFKASNSARFSVIVNHLRAKSGCGSGANADLGDGQGCQNGTRVLQATRLANVFLQQVIAASGDPDVLVIGDMNAYGAEDPINVLQQAGLVNEIERLVRGATGMVDGNPYITIRELEMRPGKKFTFPVKFNNPEKAAISYPTKVYTGTF
jgi:hypothetical protein